MKLLSFLFCCFFIISFRTFAQKSLEGKWLGTFEGEYSKSTVSWIFSDHTYTLDLQNDGSVEVTGRWETKDDHLYLWDTGGPMGCPESQRGEYTFEINKNNLRITLVEDICPGRKMMGPNVEWIRQE